MTLFRYHAFEQKYSKKYHIFFSLQICVCWPFLGPLSRNRSDTCTLLCCIPLATTSLRNWSRLAHSSTVHHRPSKQETSQLEDAWPPAREPGGEGSPIYNQSATNCPMLDNKLPSVSYQAALSLPQSCPMLDNKLPSVSYQAALRLSPSCPMLDNNLPSVSYEAPLSQPPSFLL